MYSAHSGSLTTLMTYGRPKCLLASAPSGEERRAQCSIRAAQPARRPLRRACEGLSGRSRCNPVEATLRVPAHRELRPTLPARGDLAILVEGDKRLFNQYGVMLVNPAKHPHVKAQKGRLLWIGLSRPKVRKPSPSTKSAASNYSFRTP